MNRYSSYTCEYKPSEIYEQRISQNVRKILRQDSEVLERLDAGFGGQIIEKDYEDKITKAFDYLIDAFDYNYEADYEDN